MNKVLLLLMCIFLLLNCQEEKTHRKTDQVPREKPVVVQIQPFADMKKKDVLYISSQIRKVYPNVEVLDAIHFPENTYYQPRNRYRADSIIKFLSAETDKGFVKIGLTSKDISATKGSNPDFGLMGLGYRPGKACVASSFRLNSRNKNAQFYKIAVHELGHTQGLDHCLVKTCFMRDAEGGNHTDELRDFCAQCKKHLKTKHWKFT